MTKSSYEELKEAGRIVKKSYRRWKNKLTVNEQAGYDLFLKLIFTVADSERFLIGAKALEGQMLETWQNPTDPVFERNLQELDFDACAAFSAQVIEQPYFEMFMHFVPNIGSCPEVRVYALDRAILTKSMTCLAFKKFMSDFQLNYSVLKSRDNKITLTYYDIEESEQEDRLDFLVDAAAVVSSIILEKPDAKEAQRRARISDCDYVKGPNGRYEAQNYYTYICDQADAQNYRNSVREKRRAYGFTGTGGTKAFHYRQAHWRYYRELGKEVFVRGFYAGRKKPEVNVVR
ncbi:hypothetical protein [Marivivens sp. JLT3646]|uniref:hypothetical protein n=1 Tax=Marivivens sp. JLT3646 TaxID=1920883 RepID=UPI0007FF1948|nr:hypothetical protein [Marivivens sp. JLT3646]APO85830.1 hypothetical protein BSK21_01495 [Marivivens sp. JLT3646]OBR37079.1 hypothetical protein A9199_07050 [Donghicola sp. JL3646]